MANEWLPDLPLDDAYWKSLLDDVEAMIPERRADGPRRSTNGPPGCRESIDMWQEAQRLLECGEAVIVQAIGANRGGLLIDWNGVQGFMPASHLSELPPHLDEDSRRAELAQRVGRTFNAKVIELDRAHNRLVVSEKAACQNRDRGEALLAELREDQVCEGVVTKVCSFGAFVELGGVEGLLHISEISWGRVNHPGDWLRPGQSVQVKVMSVDRAQKRIALSLKRLQPDPWATVAQRYQIGQVVEGVVTSVVQFGAFTRLEDGLEGLIHVSELAEGNFLHPNNVVREGQTVHVRVLSIDGPHRRLGLSLRQADGEAGTRIDTDGHGSEFRSA
jgi:small subunit ribosomal protein S1